MKGAVKALILVGETTGNSRDGFHHEVRCPITGQTLRFDHGTRSGIRDKIAEHYEDVQDHPLLTSLSEAFFAASDKTEAREAVVRVLWEATTASP